jgi:hypothetical protein
MAQIDRIGRLDGPLRVTCTGCRNARIWTPAQALRLFGGDCTTTAAKRRLVCSACGERRSYMFEFTAA